MDIEILLWLQSIREAAGPVVETIANFITNAPTSIFSYIIPLLLYLCLDKRAGQFLMLSFGISTCGNNLIKSTACINRPWIRDARVVPSEIALPDATGYSFPSGHVQITGSIYGGAGWYYREHRWPLVAGVVLTLLVAFSRCYLGVHTPQDVIVGLLVAVASIWAASYVIGLLDKESFDLRRVLIGALVAAIVMVLYVALKPYPPAVEGADPSKLWIDSFKAIGVFICIIIGIFLEQTYVGFSTDCPLREKIIRVVVSLALAAVVFLACQPVKAAGYAEVYAFVHTGFPIAAAIWGGPAITKLIVGKIFAAEPEE